MSLEETFKTYTDLVRATIAASKRDTATTGTIKQSTYDVLNLRSLVEDLEARAEFQTLIKETAPTLSKEPYKDTSFGHLMWKDNVESFFRRSGFYLSVYNGEIQDTDDVFRRYVEAFKQEKALRRYLVPLEFVDFGDEIIDFGSFRIVRFSRNELEALLQTKINQIFFPYAYADLSELSGLWLLEVVETTDAWEPGSGGLIELGGPEVSVTFTDFPRPVEYALKLLALYDWGTYQAAYPAKDKLKYIKELDTGWERFHIPFIISINENQLWSPAAIPNLSVIATQPEGEEMGESPVILISLETDQFKERMQRIANLMAELEEVRANQWAFLDVALGYLVKGFFANGLDQLLWHMVVVESLLGDKGDSEISLTKRLQKRAAFVVAPNKHEISNKEKLVGDLYALRSNMVHGNTELINSKVYLGHLREARELARSASLWFLESLNNLSKQSSERAITGKIPTRKEIIAAMDVLLDDKVDTDNVKFALDILPIGRTT